MADNKTSKKNELKMDNNDQMLEKEKIQEMVAIQLGI